MTSSGFNIPNVITPNGDGVNDTWIIEGLVPFPNNTVFIFSKWGELVYKKPHYTNDWNGSGSDGASLPDGTYYYLVELKRDPKDPLEVYKGSILIKR